MVAFPKPTFDYNYVADAQVAALLDYRDNAPGRAIPQKQSNRLLIATWNIANLGVQKRRGQDYRLLAEMITWFDIVAVEEVNDNLAGLRAIKQHLPQSYRMLFSDAGGNKERIAFLYDGDKVTQLEKVGEIAIPPSDMHNIKLPGIQQKFDGFDRNPYIAAFRCGTFVFLLAAVHIFFGSESAQSMNRRSLETFAVARWADIRRKSPHAYTPNVIALGDFNLPKAEPGDPIFEALTKRGLELPKHTSAIGSSLDSDKHYDQIAFFPGPTQQQFTGLSGIFDFDGALFKSLWQDRPANNHADFFAYMRYYISDHRLLWAEFMA